MPADRSRLAGRGQIALLCGEVGIGKSRLVAEATAYAAGQGFLVLRGHCFQMDCAYPYAPLLDLVRAATAPSGGGAGSAADAVLRAFARLLPGPAPAPPAELPATLPDPEHEKHRLFAALTRFFQELATQQPLLLVFKDQHRCEDTSLDNLQARARVCAAHPLPILLNYRSDEIQPGRQPLLA